MLIVSLKMPNPLRTLTDTQLAERLEFAKLQLETYAEVIGHLPATDVVVKSARYVEEAARRLRVLAGLREWLEVRHKSASVREDHNIAIGYDTGVRWHSAQRALVVEAIAELDRQLAEGQED